MVFLIDFEAGREYWKPNEDSDLGTIRYIV